MVMPTVKVDITTTEGLSNKRVRIAAASPGLRPARNEPTSINGVGFLLPILAKRGEA